MTLDEMFAAASPSSAASNVQINLNSIERDDAAAGLQAFEFQLGDRAIILIDPQELDWFDIIEASSNPAILIERALSDDDRKYFYSQKVAAWKVGKLAEAYMTYYGLEPQGN